MCVRTSIRTAGEETFRALSVRLSLRASAEKIVIDLFDRSNATLRTGFVPHWYAYGKAKGYKACRKRAYSVLRGSVEARTLNDD